MADSIKKVYILSWIEDELELCGRDIIKGYTPARTKRSIECLKKSIESGMFEE